MHTYSAARGYWKNYPGTRICQSTKLPSTTADNEPCNICSSCKEIASGHSLDVWKSMEPHIVGSMISDRSMKQSVMPLPPVNIKFILLMKSTCSPKKLSMPSLKRWKSPTKVYFCLPLLSPIKYCQQF